MLRTVPYLPDANQHTFENQPRKHNGAARSLDFLQSDISLGRPISSPIGRGDIAQDQTCMDW